MCIRDRVTTTTEGYNYIALNDDVYMYTGVTSAGTDQSNVGFLLVNQRTKDAKYYNVTGAEERSAMSSAEGAVQHLNYTATLSLIHILDYTNQLRLEGVEKRRALVLTGQARMRPILMTALTTILSMCSLIFSQSTTAAASRGMAIVVAGGLAYATLMTLFVVPVMYDIFYRKQPRVIDLDDEVLDDQTRLLEH